MEFWIPIIEASVVEHNPSFPYTGLTSIRRQIIFYINVFSEDYKNVILVGGPLLRHKAIT